MELRKLTELLFILTILLLLLATFNKGLTLNDEGYVLQAGQRILHGELPYRDYFFVYTPLSAYITAGAFLLFGQSVIASRVVVLFFSIAALIAVWLIAKRLTKNTYVIAITVLFFTVWSPLHTNFSWPVVYSLTFTLWNVYCFLQFLETKQYRYVVFAGLLTSLVFLTKQNFGAAVLANGIIMFLCIKEIRTRKSFIMFTVPFLLPIILFVIQIYLSGSVSGTVENFYYYFFKKLIIDHNGSTPFIYILPSFVKTLIKAFFYLSPLIISVATLIYSLLKKRNTYFFLSTTTVLYYLTGIRPVTDIVHLTPLVSLLCLPYLEFVVMEKSKISQLIATLVAGVFILVGLYNAFFNGYYKWEQPLIKQTVYQKDSRLQIFLDDKSAREIKHVTKFIDQNSKINDYIFIYHYVPTFYFLADRKNATRFIYIHPNVLDSQYRKEVINDLKEKHVNLIVTDKNLREDTSSVSVYIRTHYKKFNTIASYDFWRKK